MGASHHTSVPLFKRCLACNQELPLTEFYKSQTNKDGYMNLCKVCRSARYGHIPHPPPRVADGMKQCSRCKSIKPATTTFFYPRKAGKLKLKSWCKDCDAEYQRINSAKLAIKQRIRRQKNINRARDYDKRWRERHPEIVKTVKLRRRSRTIGLLDTLTPNNWQQALAYFGGFCAVCGRPPGLWHTLAADHWIPLSSPDCPGTIPSNIIPLCHGIDGCNNSKSDRDPVEWLFARFGARKAKQILKRIEAYFSSLKDKP